MKKIFFILLSISSFAAFGQQPLSITMDSLDSGSKGRNSFTVDIPQATLKDVEHNWLKYVGKRATGNASIVNGEHIQDGVVNKNISPEPFTVYSNLTGTPAGVRLTVRLGENSIASGSEGTNSAQDLAVQKFMGDFAKTAYRQAVQDGLKTEHKKLRDLEKEMARVVKNEEKSKKKIRKYERANEKDAAAIAAKESDIQTIVGDIEGQKEMIKLTASDPNATKGAKKTLAQIESKKRKLEKKIEKINRGIENRDKDIRAENRVLDVTRQELETKATAVEAQRVMVNAVTQKLDGLK